MNIALVDDLQGAHDQIESLIARHAELVESGLSTRIEPSGHNYDVLIEKINSYKGQLSLIVDLKLGLAAFNDADFRRDVAPERALLEQCEAELSQQGAAELFQGLWVAVRAILTNGINPLSIIVASSSGVHECICEFLAAIAKRCRPDGGVAIGYHRANSAVPKHAERLLDLLRSSQVDASKDRFKKFVRAVSSVTHQNCDRRDLSALKALDLLLGMDHASVTYPERWIDELKNLGAVLRDGEPLGRPLTLLGGWLIALGRFRQSWPSEPWEAVFSVADTTATEGWVGSQLLMPQQRSESLEQSMEAFDDMCRCLFKENSAANLKRPEQKVTLSNQTGLEIQVGGFDALASPKSKSLYFRLAELSQGAVGFSGPPEKHETSSALWKVLMCSFLADYGNDDPTVMSQNVEDDGIFGSICRMNIFSNHKTSTVSVRFIGRRRH